MTYKTPELPGLMRSDFICFAHPNHVSKKQNPLYLFGNQGRSGYVLIWASAPPNILFLPNSKSFFAQMGKNIDPFLAIFFAPPKI
jgi:hypothetical protein